MEPSIRVRFPIAAPFRASTRRLVLAKQKQPRKRLFLWTIRYNGEHMGSYCNYNLDDWELETSKSYVIPELAEVFHEMDKKVTFINEDGEKQRKIKYITDANTATM